LDNTEQKAENKPFDYKSAAWTTFILPLFGGLYIYGLAKEDKVARFNALQSVALVIAYYVFRLIFLSIFGSIIIFFKLLGIQQFTTYISSGLYLTYLILWIFLLKEALNHRIFKIPVLSSFIEKQV